MRAEMLIICVFDSSMSLENRKNRIGDLNDLDLRELALAATSYVVGRPIVIVVSHVPIIEVYFYE